MVTDQLDGSKLDFSTFALGPIAFGTRVMDVPPGQTSFTGDVDLRPGVDLIARVTAGFDSTTGLATWHFFSLDPATGQPTRTRSSASSLPTSRRPEGEGHVSFTVARRPGLASRHRRSTTRPRSFSTRIPPIVTADWLNTLDVTAPSSQVAALPPSACSGILVQWSGSDAHSGIARYDVFASENGGGFFLWKQDTTVDLRDLLRRARLLVCVLSAWRATSPGTRKRRRDLADATTTVGNPTPLVDLLEPDSGPAAGAPVTLTGSGFEPAHPWSSAARPRRGVVVQRDPTSIDALFPALAPGRSTTCLAANASSCADTLVKGWFADFNDVPDVPLPRLHREDLPPRRHRRLRRRQLLPRQPGHARADGRLPAKAKYSLALVPPPATGTLFGDVPVGSFAADWIEQLASRGHHRRLRRRQLLPRQLRDPRPRWRSSC